VNPPLTDRLLRLRQVLDGPQWLFVGFVGLLLLGGAAAALAHQPALLLPALLAVGLLLALVEWRWVYYALFAVLPFSQEIGLFGGLSMDVPSEPLMLVLTACVGLALLLRQGTLPRREWGHPLFIILALMLVWTAVDTVFSVDYTKSLKYLLAKVWYLVPFVLGTLHAVWLGHAGLTEVLGSAAVGAALALRAVVQVTGHRPAQKLPVQSLPVQKP